MSLLGAFFGGGQNAVAGSTSAIDVVAYAASLASNPKTIDPILDTFREVTSHVKPNQALSAADQTALATVYLQLEQYLTTKEPIRAFTAAEIRQRVEARLRPQHASNPLFWEKLRSAS